MLVGQLRVVQSKFWVYWQRVQTWAGVLGPWQNVEQPPLPKMTPGARRGDPDCQLPPLQLQQLPVVGDVAWLRALMEANLKLKTKKIL